MEGKSLFSYFFTILLTFLLSISFCPCLFASLEPLAAIEFTNQAPLSDREVGFTQYRGDVQRLATEHADFIKNGLAQGNRSLALRGLQGLKDTDMIPIREVSNPWLVMDSLFDALDAQATQFENYGLRCAIAEQLRFYTHGVYLVSRREKRCIRTDTKDKYLERINQLLKTIRENQAPGNRLRFELDTLSAMFSALPDTTSFWEIAYDTVQELHAFYQDKDIGRAINLGQRIYVYMRDQYNQAWYEVVLLIDYYKLRALDDIEALRDLQTLLYIYKQKRMDRRAFQHAIKDCRGDWHILCAGIDALTYIALHSPDPYVARVAFQNKSKQAPGVAYYLDFAKFFHVRIGKWDSDNKNWRIREKSIESALLLSLHDDEWLAEKAKKHFFVRIRKEAHPAVRILLDKPNYITSVHEALQRDWRDAKTNLGTELTQQTQELEHRWQNIIAEQQTKCEVILSSLLRDHQENINQEMEQQKERIEKFKAALGKDVHELKAVIYDHYETLQDIFINALERLSAQLNFQSQEESESERKEDNENLEFQRDQLFRWRRIIAQITGDLLEEGSPLTYQVDDLQALIQYALSQEKGMLAYQINALDTLSEKYEITLTFLSNFREEVSLELKQIKADIATIILDTEVTKTKISEIDTLQKHIAEEIHRLRYGHRQPMLEEEVEAWLIYSLRHYSDKNCSDFSNIFGTRNIPIRKYYTQLAIIEQAREEINDTEATLRQTLVVNHKTVNARKTPIDIRDIWGKNSKAESGEVCKLLIWGRAGVGKTTLCKSVFHGWHREGLWAQEHFKAVIWLPLRQIYTLLQQINLNPNESLTLAHLLEPLLSWPHSGLHPPTVESLQAYLEQHGNKILWILDGYDEIVDQLQEGTPHNALFTQAVQQDRVIITSRPTGQDILGLDADSVIENMGFNDEQIEEYINECFEEDYTGEPKMLLKFLHLNPEVWNIMHVPIHLEIFIFLSQGEGQDWLSTTTNLSVLYDRMMQYQENIQNLYSIANGKAQRSGLNLEDWADVTEEYTWGDLCLYTLGYFAYQGMIDNTIILSHKSLKKALDHVLPAFQPLRREKSRGDHKRRLLNHIFQLGFLRTVASPKHEQYYEFLHLSFQEYLAGCWMAHVWNRGRTEEREALQEIWASDAYRPWYRGMGRFASGRIHTMVQVPQEGASYTQLNDWFNILWDAPKDLVGLHQMLTLIYNYQETSYTYLQTDAARMASRNIIHYLQVTLKEVKNDTPGHTTTPYLSLFQALGHCTLIRKTCLESDFWWQAWDSFAPHQQLIFIQHVKGTHPIFWKIILASLNDKKSRIRREAFYALSALFEDIVPEMEEEILLLLTENIAHSDNHVRRDAVRSLRALAPCISPKMQLQILKLLLEKIQSSGNRYICKTAVEACKVLCEHIHPGIQTRVLSLLISVGRSPDADTRINTMEILGDLNPHLSPEGQVEALSFFIEASEDVDNSIVYIAVDNLRRLPVAILLQEENISFLLRKASETEVPWVQQSALIVLSGLVPYLSTAIREDFMHNLFEDIQAATPHIRSEQLHALKAFYHPISLPGQRQVFSLLVDALMNGDKSIRRAALLVVQELYAYFDLNDQDYVLTTVMDKIKDEAWQVRHTAQDTLKILSSRFLPLETLAERIFPFFMNLVRHEDCYIRQSSISVLRELFTHSLPIAQIREITSVTSDLTLNDISDDVRIIATGALSVFSAKLDPEVQVQEVLPALLSLASNDNNNDVRRAATRALSVFSAKLDPEVQIQEVLPTLLSLTSNNNSNNVRNTAILALPVFSAKLDPEVQVQEVLPALFDLLRGSNDNIQTAVTTSLNKIYAAGLWKERHLFIARDPQLNNYTLSHFYREGILVRFPKPTILQLSDGQHLATHILPLELWETLQQQVTRYIQEKECSIE